MFCTVSVSLRPPESAADDDGRSAGGIGVTRAAGFAGGFGSEDLGVQDLLQIRASNWFSVALPFSRPSFSPGRPRQGSDKCF